MAIVHADYSVKMDFVVDLDSDQCPALLSYDVPGKVVEYF